MLVRVVGAGGAGEQRRPTAQRASASERRKARRVDI